MPKDGRILTGRRAHVWVKLSGIMGVVTPFVAFACILLSISSYPLFSWTNNALSDLGVKEGITAPLFNSGLIISGIFALVFAAGLLRLLPNSLISRIGILIFIFAALALTAIGIFPENAKPMHYFASVAFFALFATAMLVVSAALLYARKLKTGLFTLVIAIVSIIPWAIEFSIRFVPGVAIPEAISALAASVWSIILGISMLKITP
jgi:hypothetical membrane protein